VPLPGEVDEAVKIETVANETDWQEFERLKRLKP
jgi:hypothetical protein